MNDSRQNERMLCAAESPLVGNPPEYPGKLAAMMISPDLVPAVGRLYRP